MPFLLESQRKHIYDHVKTEVVQNLTAAVEATSRTSPTSLTGTSISASQTGELMAEFYFHCFLISYNDLHILIYFDTWYDITLNPTSAIIIR